ncbi:hypothetical protein LJB92_01420 [Bacteroidales bacterium OttesenSCG-928-M06]|nr:hypothetical protein [Bacteroidales bacterium OttesenSCG-928-M06]
MKKLLYLSAIFIIFISCDNDEDKGNHQGYRPFELSNSIYALEIEKEIINEATGEVSRKDISYKVFEFKSDTEVIYAERENPFSGESSVPKETYYYIFDFPGINMLHNKNDGKPAISAYFQNKDSLQVLAKGGWFIKIR